MPVKKVSKSPARPAGWLPKTLILAGLVILVAVVFLLKNQSAPAPTLANLDSETQLDSFLENNQPVFVFFHSTTCKTCVDMMGIVDLVYPDFKGRVGLVDVDVYGPENEELLRRARITNIPTQVFINAKGESRTVIGGMQPDELRSVLQALAEGRANGN